MSLEKDNLWHQNSTLDFLLNFVCFLQRIQEKIPADPFEAELLMMAEMVASDKKDEGGTTDDDSNAAGMYSREHKKTTQIKPNAFLYSLLNVTSIVTMFYFRRIFFPTKVFFRRPLFIFLAN